MFTYRTVNTFDLTTTKVDFNQLFYVDSVMSYLYGPDLVVVYVLLQGLLVNVIVNQNNTT